MKVAHLILAHKAPAQLERLVQALTHPQADVYIHLDKKTDEKPFAALATLPGVQFTKCRLDVKWGGYSLTEVVIEGMREILQPSVAYDFINIMSGEDYPIKPLSTIHSFLQAHLGHSFLEYDVEGSPWWQANQSRIEEYHFTEFQFPGKYAVQKLINRVMPRRKMPLLPTLYGGNMGGWYTLSQECAAYAIQYLDAHPQLRRFARLTWGSDEFLIHSILLNSPFAVTITNNNLRYIDWSGGGSSPKTFTIADLPSIASSSRLFARKFDSNRDELILNKLDQLNQEG